MCKLGRAYTGALWLNELQVPETGNESFMYKGLMRRGGKGSHVLQALCMASWVSQTIMDPVMRNGQNLGISVNLTLGYESA